MDNLKKLIEDLQSRDKMTKAAIGGLSSSFIDYARQVNKFSQVSEFNSIAKVALQYNKITFPESIAKSVLGHQPAYLKSISDMTNLGIKQNYLSSLATRGISNSLIEFAKGNQALTDKITKSLSSQIAFSNSMVNFANSIQNPTLKHYNALSVALNGFSAGYLKNLIHERDWDNLDTYNDVTDKIKSVTDDFVNQTKVATLYDLENFKTIIVEELSSIFRVTTSSKVKHLILNLITLVSFIITLYTLKVQKGDISNKEVVENTAEGFKKLKNDIGLEIRKEFEKLQKTRTARIDVVLRYSNSPKSKSLGLVKKGQEVFVIEIRHKWLLISYIDDETKEPKSGFVYKKYFTEK